MLFGLLVTQLICPPLRLLPLLLPQFLWHRLIWLLSLLPLLSLFRLPLPLLGWPLSQPDCSRARVHQEVVTCPDEGPVSMTLLKAQLIPTPATASALSRG